MRFKRVLINLLLIGSILFSMVAISSLATSVAAQPAPPSVVFDDFEDGDSSDWGFFGGNNAGGGGGVLSDRPKEGSFYLSTGWGGQGSASVFYGGFYKNLDNASQLVLPVDPWFNVWVLNQSDATADQYTLEITIREDLDGNGWTDGVDDSFRLDTVFLSTAFDDEWVLVSAPVGSFADLFTGGDGTFDGNLDEVVVVISGVQGADGSTVEADFDFFAFTSGGPLAFSEVLFDDMEHGDPLANGWFSFGGSVGGGGIAPNTSDLPPTLGGSFSLETGWGSGGTPGYFGGFGRNFPVDLSGTTHFNFWINPDSGQDYMLEINLQDDDDGDGLIGSPADDEFQFNCVVSATGPCAVSGDGWQLVSIPLDDFFDDNSFLTGGNGVFDPVPAARGGNGQLISVVLAVISNSGADVTFRTDYWAFTDGPLMPTMDEGRIVDDFESGLPSGSDGDGNAIGFFTFQDSDLTTVDISTTDAPPDPVPGASDPNNVLQVETHVVAGGWAGLVHAFENEALDTWTPQDWSAFEGFSFWLYGNNTGKILFVDILDNRAPGSTGDTAERFSIDIPDDFSGWQFFEIPFGDFNRKEIGNGAPNDGFTLTEVHGWAFGVFSSAEPFINYLDDVGLYGMAEIPELAVGFSANAFDVAEGDTAVVSVKLNRSMSQEDDPEEVTVSYSTEDGSATSGRDYTPAAGTLTFVKGGASEQSFTVPTFDNNKHDGDKTVLLHLTDPVGAPLGLLSLARIDIEDDEPFDPTLIDDFERFPYLWEASDNVILSNLEIMADDPLALPGQGAYEGVLDVTAPLGVDIDVKPGDSDGNLCNSGKGVIPVALLTTDAFDATTVDHSTVTLGDAYETHVNKKTGELQRHVEDVDGDGDMDLVFHFRYDETGLPCDPDVVPFNGWTFDGQPITAGGANAHFGREFALGRDWSFADGLRFWYYGQNTGDTVTVELLDNRAPDPAPAGWSLMWSDEFDDPVGTPPNPSNWTPEIGDGTINANPGWGNGELEYYTDSVENAATDGQGNLVITAKEADGSLECYYGPCEYTSARLISWHKAEFAYGRIEARLQVPFGQGLWPAFWALGTDIGEVGWPQSGELDIMEHIGREPTTVYGTVHGPGYSGGAGVGAGYEHPEGDAFSDDFHVFAVEWEPDEIRWYVDGVQFFAVTPDDVSGEWVFDHPFFIILNVAVGGNWPGYPDETTVFPQTMRVDYVRVYQGPDTAERFEASFTDDLNGWQEVLIPFDSFARSAEQPDGAPDDGLGLSEVWGYGFKLPDAGTTTGSLLLDQVRLEGEPDVSGVIVDDFEAGVPTTWFQYGDYGNGSSITASTVVVTDRPGGVPSTSVLSVDYVSAGWGAGTGRDLVPPQDWSAHDGLSFWFNGSNSGTTYELILSDNKSDPNADTAERFHATFTDDFAGWQHISLPWDVFYRGGWQPPGAPDDGLTLTEMWAYAIALPIGTDGVFYIDDVALYKLDLVDDFEAGVPATWFQYGDYGNGSSITASTVVVADRPGGVPSTSVLSVDYVSAGWGAGTGRDLVPPQDWSAHDGLSFWFNGSNSGTTYELILSDNKSDPNADTAERFHATFTDDFAGWQHISLPWDVFYRGGWQPPGAPDDGLTLTEMWAYAIALPIGTDGVFYLDDVALVK